MPKALAQLAGFVAVPHGELAFQCMVVVLPQVTVQEVCPPVAGTVPVGLPGMVGERVALLTCDAFGHVIVFQFVPAATSRVTRVPPVRAVREAVQSALGLCK
ncbi:MAG: hypothetical protein FWE28_09000 [Oscillospiraceae bacterium]|nr:hypothetical protein [Oscillospiraceae bacterium]